MNGLCSHSDRNEIRNDAPVSVADSRRGAEHVFQPPFSGDGVEDGNSSHERPTRLRKLIAAAVRVWELKRGCVSELAPEHSAVLRFLGVRSCPKFIPRADKARDGIQD